MEGSVFQFEGLSCPEEVVGDDLLELAALCGVALCSWWLLRFGCPASLGAARGGTAAREVFNTKPQATPVAGVGLWG